MIYNYTRGISYLITVYVLIVITINAANIHYSSLPTNINMNATYIPGHPYNNTVCNIYDIHHINYVIPIIQIVFALIIMLGNTCFYSQLIKSTDPKAPPAILEPLTEQHNFPSGEIIILAVIILQLCSIFILTHGAGNSKFHNIGIIDYYKSISQFAVVGCNPVQVWLIYANIFITDLPSILFILVLGFTLIFSIIYRIRSLIISWTQSVYNQVWHYDYNYDCDKLIKQKHANSSPELI